MAIVARRQARIRWPRVEVRNNVKAEDQPIDPSEALRRLRQHCCPFLSQDADRTLAARCVAGSLSHAAKRLFVSERAFRDHWARVQDQVLIAAGLARDPCYMALWVALHRACCTVRVWEMMETSAVFPAEM